jgi:quinol monooxygenase YgiN
MIKKVAIYKVKREELGAVESAVREFVGEIAGNEPQTNYEAFQADDDVSFVHIMSFPDEAAEALHRNAQYTGKFVEILYPRCMEGPNFLDLRLIGSTRRP